MFVLYKRVRRAIFLNESDEKHKCHKKNSNLLLDHGMKLRTKLNISLD